jgi:hypothetical protein
MDLGDRRRRERLGLDTREDVVPEVALDRLLDLRERDCGTSSVSLDSSSV